MSVTLSHQHSTRGRFQYGAMEVPAEVASPGGILLTLGEWLVLQVILDHQAGRCPAPHPTDPHPSVKHIAWLLGWNAKKPQGVIDRIRRLEAKGVLQTTQRSGSGVRPDGTPERLTDVYEVVG